VKTKESIDKRMRNDTLERGFLQKKLITEKYEKSNSQGNQTENT
jgi:hypothetical protein